MDYITPTVPTSGEFADQNTYREAVAYVQAASRMYYTSGEVLCDDATYDTLMRAIAATETTHPEWVETEAASGQVAAGAVKGDIAHVAKLLSLDNVFSADELTGFCDRVRELAETTDITWTIEPKFDGMAMAASYRSGKLVQLVTRGDGTKGEDVSRVLGRDPITGLPPTLSEDIDLEVRGEMVMSSSDFEAANDAREAHGDSRFVNQRNAVAGTVRSESRSYAIPLSFCAYDVVTADGASWKGTHREAMAELAKLGVLTTASLILPDHAPALVSTTADPAEAVARIERLRSQLEFPIDGAVIKVDTAGLRTKLGSTSRAPRWAIAYKYPPETRLTRLNDIVLSVGRTGRVTPVAELEPIYVGGVTVSSATLHNPTEVLRRDVRPGDMVWVRRAGDVIPEITGPDLTKRPEDSTPWKAPTICPRCGTKLDTSEVTWRCPNTRCGLPEQVAYFASRKAMDIDGLGDKIVNSLIDAGLVEDVADLFTLNVDKVAALPRMGATSARNLVASIDGAKSQGMARVLTGLGVRFLGRRLSERVSAVYPDIATLLNEIDAGTDTLDDIDGIGPVRGASIREELASLRPLIDKLAAAGVDTESKAAQTTAGGALDGVKLLITGSVPGYTRDGANEAAAAAGATVASSVSAKLDVLCIGNKPGGSKLAKADKLGLATYDVSTAEAFEALLTNGLG